MSVHIGLELSSRATRSALHMALQLCSRSVHLCGVDGLLRTIPKDIAPMHADSHFLHLGGNQSSVCKECSAAVVARNAGVTVVSSTFEQPYRAPGSRYIHAQAGALLRFNAARCCVV
jgi:hypothetical protein